MNDELTKEDYTIIHLALFEFAKVVLKEYKCPDEYLAQIDKTNLKIEQLRMKAIVEASLEKDGIVQTK